MGGPAGTSSGWVDPGVTLNGNMLVDGTIAAQKINTRGLDIKADDGTVLFSANTKLDASLVAGLGLLAVKDGVDTVTIGGTVVSTTDLVSSLRKISSSNIGIFMDTSAITTAYIGVAEVDTLRIKGNAVTVPMFGSTDASTAFTNGIELDAGASVLIMANASVFSTIDGWYNATIRVGLVGPQGVIWATGGGGGYTRVSVFGNVSAFGIVTITQAGTYMAGSLVSIEAGSIDAGNVFISPNSVVAMSCKR
jgi:hypothetical protein